MAQPLLTAPGRTAGMARTLLGVPREQRTPGAKRSWRFGAAPALLVCGWLLLGCPAAVHAQFVGPSTITITNTFTGWGTTNPPASGVSLIQDASNTGEWDKGGNSIKDTADINWFWQAISTTSGGTTVASATNPIQNVYYRIDTFGTKAGNGQNYAVQLNLGAASPGYADHILQIRLNSDATVDSILYSYPQPYPPISAFTTGTPTPLVSNKSGYGVSDPNAIGAFAPYSTNAGVSYYGVQVKIPISWFGTNYGGKVRADGSGAGAIVGALFTFGGSVGAVSATIDSLNNSAGTTVLSATSTTTGSTVYATTNISQISFTTPPWTNTAGTVAGPMTVQTQDGTGAPQSVGTPTSITLSSSSATGKFYSDAGANTPITNVTIAATSNSASFYYKDTTSGSPILTGSPTNVSWTAATQQETVTPAAPNAYRLTDTAGGTLTPGGADALTIKLADQYGNTVTSFTGDKNLTFSGLSLASDGTTHPTVTDKNSNPVNLGTAELLTFANGVASAGGSLVAYKAETQTLNVQDNDSPSLSSTSPGGAGLNVTVTNAAPAAPGLTFTRSPGLTLKISISNILASGTDANHDLISLAGIGSPATTATTSAQGASVFISGSFVYYKPNSADTGDTFPYSLSDGHGGTTQGTITVLVVQQGGAAQNVSYSSGGVTVIFAGQPGYTYEIQRSTNANFSSPTPLATTNAPAAGVFLFTDPSPPNPSAYYRLIQH